MEYLNIPLPNDHVLTLGYSYADSAYVFEQDIGFNGWIISKIIKQGGPKYSGYKYDFKNYFEFVITDSDGISRIKRYFYNKGDNEVLAYWGECPIEAIPYYIQSSLIFQCKDWADYDICKTLADIKKVINMNISQQEQLKRIKQILNNL